MSGRGPFRDVDDLPTEGTENAEARARGDHERHENHESAAERGGFISGDA